MLILLIIFQSLFCSEKKIIAGIDENQCLYELSLCAIFHDEAPYLKEWLEYHRIVGVQHFYLYNNNSTDHFADVLSSYINQGLVELIEWPSPPLEDWTPYQEAAYNHCIKHCIGETKWLAIVDLDEFIVPVKAKTIQSVLQRYDLNHIGGLMMHWQIYGTSNCQTLDPRKLLIEQLVMKAAIDHPWNHHVKTICKPHTVSYFHVHGARYKKGYHDVTSNGRGGPDQPIQMDHIRVNHYWTRDEAYFRKHKVPRRELYERRIYSEESIAHFLAEFNQQQDKAIFRFIPALKKRVL